MFLRYLQSHRFIIIVTFLAIVVLALGATLFYILQKLETEVALKNKISNEKSNAEKNFQNSKKEIEKLRNEDQRVRNDSLEALIKSIETTYADVVKAYEKLLDLKDVSKKTETLDTAFADAVNLLSERNYASTSSALTKLQKEIDAEKAKVTSSFVIPANVVQESTPPSAGYRRQLVNSDVGEFMVDIISADLNSTKVIVDTASDSDCRNDCPVLSLGDYVSRSGAYAGINGSYFCPSTYPSCSDKKNSYDTLLMNKNNTYFNSDNNVYSTVPAVIFSGSSARFVGQSLEWGRDTGVDAVIANQPLLVAGGNVVYGGGSEPKHGSKGPRGFVGATGSTVYIGVVFNATVGESAHVLKSLGMQSALNLDSGGSTALWSGGYRVGPGRNIPNAILFVRK